ncbi:peptidoglycan-binding domain-containing protein [Streptomyces sp. NPDC001732]
MPSGEDQFFGKVSTSRRDGRGARPADIELFEENAPLPETLSAGPLSPPPSTSSRPDLALGSTGHDVKDLQQRLQQLPLYLGSADGTFTANAEAALSRYQKARNIPEKPGVYGAITRAALHAETESPGQDSHRYGNSYPYPDHAMSQGL